MRRNGAAFLVVQHRVEDEEDGEQNGGGEAGLHQQMNGGPEEAHALEEAEEQGRVAQRREGAADIGNEEDEENNLMYAEAAMFVGPEQRTDEEHGRAGGAHPACDDRAYQQNPRIDDGRSDQRALETDAARHGEQGKQQKNEGHVFQKQRFRREEEGRAGAEHDEAGHEEGQAPEDRHLAEVMFPEVGDGQRAERDGQQHTHKRNDPDDGQILRQRRVGREAERGGQQQCQQGRHKGTQFGHTGLLHNSKGVRKALRSAASRPFIRAAL